LESRLNCLRFWYQKHMKRVKILFGHELLVLLRREILLHRECIEAETYIVSISTNKTQYIYIIYFNNICIIITATCFDTSNIMFRHF
jgi:hypothetical protein